MKQRIDLFNFISQWWITLLRHGRIHIIHLKLAQKHILAVSVGKQTNEQIDKLTKKKKDHYIW